MVLKIAITYVAIKMNNFVLFKMVFKIAFIYVAINKTMTRRRLVVTQA